MVSSPSLVSFLSESSDDSLVVLLLEQKLPVGVDVSNNEDGKEKDDDRQIKGSMFM